MITSRVFIVCVCVERMCIFNNWAILKIKVFNPGTFVLNEAHAKCQVFVEIKMC